MSHPSDYGDTEFEDDFDDEFEDDCHMSSVAPAGAVAASRREPARTG